MCNKEEHLLVIRT